MKRFLHASLFTTACLMVMVLVADAVQAQGRGGRGGGRGQGGPGGRGMGMMGGMGGNYFGLIGFEPVQKEVEISEDQLEDFQSLQREMGEKMRELMQDARGGGGRPDFEAMRGAMEEAAKEMSQEMETILLPHQVDRLKEIWVQQQGANALMNPEIQEELGFSSKQKDELQEAMNDVGEKRRELFMGFRGGEGERPSREEMQEKMQELQKETEKELMEVLDSGQKKKFEDMKGKPFKELDQLQGRFGGRRGPAAGGQQRRRGGGGQGGGRRRGGGGGRGGNGGGELN